MYIDATFDFRTDSRGKDPDTYSPTLKQYHRHLWSKALPTGGELILDKNLKNTSDVGEFFFSSDSVIHTFTYWVNYQHIIRQVDPKVTEDFVYKSYTIGGMLIFPANQVNRKPTINAARGMNKTISDRLDLTMECIRRYYLDQRSPLYDCLARYDSFFRLFGSFRGYIEFFLLDDMVNSDDSIRFMHPFEEFGKNVLPANLEEYNTYREKTLEFVDQRNARIDRTYNR